MKRIVEDAILVYTDGSLYPRGRKGGYGMVFVHVDPIGEEHVIDECSPPGSSGTTGNRMELQGCVEALKRVHKFDCFKSVSRIVIRTDSRYLADHYLRAIGTWSRSGWHNLDGRPIENADVWKELVRAFRKIQKPVRIEWIKGHGKGQAKDPYNRLADRLAKASAQSPLSRRTFRSSVRRKRSSKRTQRGSVDMLGQTMVIYIVEVQWLSVQRVWKYRYEVVSKDSPFNGNLDWIFSQEYMRDGHDYEVRVNDDSANPRILEVIRQIGGADEG